MQIITIPKWSSDIKFWSAKKSIKGWGEIEEYSRGTEGGSNVTNRV